MEFLSDVPVDGSKSAWQDLRKYAADAAAQGGIVSAQQAAKLLGVSKQAVHDAIKRGRLQVFKYPELGLTGVGVSQIKAYARERQLPAQGHGAKRGLANG